MARPISRLSVAVLLLVGLVSGPAWAEGQRAVLSYDVHLGGFSVGQAEVTVILGPQSYRMESRMSTSGFIARLTDFSVSSRSVGAWMPGNDATPLRPSEHVTTSRWRGEDRRVELIYGPPASAPVAMVEPPPAQDDRDPVPEAARIDTLDPMSGVLALMTRVMGDDATPVPIYDGRRRYTLAALGMTPEALDETGFSGAGWRVRIGYERQAGAMRGRSGFGSSARARTEAEAALYVAPGAAFGLPVPVPVRLVVDGLPMGGLVARLTGVYTASQTAPQNADSCFAPC